MEGELRLTALRHRGGAARVALQQRGIYPDVDPAIHCDLKNAHFLARKQL